MVIEHDMAFVRRLEAPVIVMHLGRVFLRGTFSEVEVNEEVRHLYLARAASAPVQIWGEGGSNRSGRLSLQLILL